ncbi:MAG TPA: hypothetical protein PLO37_18145 [Candidatus Hydrogenedentes bacterium]|nr:hypothetical protein [Candidatus Hydrogenedentota bacterium]HPG68773.1 hypothetical protein [Candidatus Hydrogenedentota bacterium]
MATFHHFGVPSSAVYEGAGYVEGGKVYVTDPETHPFRIEFLRFEEGSPMHELVRTRPHAAFAVDDLDAALEGRNVIVEPFNAMPTLRVAFITDGDAVIELMQNL